MSKPPKENLIRLTVWLTKPWDTSTVIPNDHGATEQARIAAQVKRLYGRGADSPSVGSGVTRKPPGVLDSAANSSTHARLRRGSLLP